MGGHFIHALKFRSLLLVINGTWFKSFTGSTFARNNTFFLQGINFLLQNFFVFYGLFSFLVFLLNLFFKLLNQIKLMFLLLQLLLFLVFSLCHTGVWILSFLNLFFDSSSLLFTFIMFFNIFAFFLKLKSYNLNNFAEQILMVIERGVIGLTSMRGHNSGNLLGSVVQDDSSRLGKFLAPHIIVRFLMFCVKFGFISHQSLNLFKFFLTFYGARFLSETVFFQCFFYFAISHCINGE